MQRVLTPPASDPVRPEDRREAHFRRAVPRPRIRAITSDRFALVQMSAIGSVKGPTKLSDHALASCSGQRRQIHRRLLHVST